MELEALKVWTMVLRPGFDALKECLDKNKVVIGWGVEANTKDYYLLREEIKKKYYPNDAGYRSAGQAAGMVYNFCNNIKKGHFIIIPYYNYKFYLAEIIDDQLIYEKERELYWRNIQWKFDKNEKIWKNAPANLSKACRNRKSLKNSSYAIEHISKIIKDPKYLEETWDKELFSKLKQHILDYLLKGRINPSTFQKEFVPKILYAMGAKEIANRAGTGDKGIDILAVFPVANYTEMRLGIQTKYWEPKPPLDKTVIDKTISGAVEENISEAWIITTGTIEKNIYDYVETEVDTKGISIKLIDGEELSEIILNYIDRNFIYEKEL